MKELLVMLSEVLGAKKDSEIAVFNEGFLDIINTTSFSRGRSLLEESFKEPKLVVDYLDSSIKRRSQTIGNAYRFALQLLLGFTFKRADLIIDLFSKRQYNDNKMYLDEIYNKPETRFVIGYHNTALALLNRALVEMPDVDDKLIDLIADTSITFTWIDVYYKTTYMPQDLTIIKTNNETHLKLKEEVKHLLKNSEEFIETIKDISLDGRLLAFEEEIVSSKHGIIGAVNIVAGGNLIDVRTTGTYPNDTKFLQDAKHLVGLHVLNEFSETPINIVNRFIYYPRFQDLVEIVVFNE